MATNASLNMYISNLNRAQAVVQQDSDYVDELDTLNHNIQRSIASMFKWSCDRNLPEEAEAKVISALIEFEPFGKKTLEMLGRCGVTIPALHKDSTTRIVLIRHLIALFLLDKVFQPFAFGLDTNVNKNMSAVEDAVFASGTFQC